ncbi:MAG: DUF4365 domain-containing protein [Pyrinomonadaceae bacterium]
MNKKYLNNLPKSDDNEELQQLSFKAIKALLPTENFQMRDERIDDKGVDASLEIKYENSFTNFRSQVQLKGTSSDKQNNDGSVSYSVKTSNLNYLLNNPVSLYFLYVQPRDEFRFVWAKDELKRLNEENPQWNEQDTITLRFVQILNEITLEQIHERILTEGELFRRLNETLIDNIEGNSRLEIQQPNFQVIDGKQAKQILDHHGIELLNAGYENFVLEKYDLLSNSEKKKNKFLLLKSRAEGLLGRYRASLDTLGIIDSINCEFSPTEKFHFDSIENHSKWMLGQINTDQFLEKLQELSTNELAENSVLDRFNFLLFSLMYKEVNEINISDLFNNIEKLKEAAEEILSDENFSQEIKIMVEFSILENELKWIIMEETSLLGESAIHKQMKMYIPEHWDRKEKFPVELKKWLEKSEELLSKAQNIIIKADISYLQTRLWFHRNQLHQFWSNNAGKEYLIEKEITDCFIKILQTITDVYTNYNQNYSIIRAKMLMVEILSLIGKSEESETLRKEINRQANAMSYESLKSLTEFSMHKVLFDYSKDEIGKND